jgi:hypothetical protein
MLKYKRARSTVHVTLHNTENTDFVLLSLVHFRVAVLENTEYAVTVRRPVSKFILGRSFRLVFWVVREGNDEVHG